MRPWPLLGVLALVAACAGQGTGIDVSDARVGQPTGPNAAMYFSATSNGDADRLVGAFTEAAAEVGVHETTTNDDGTMGMRPVAALDLPAGGRLVLEPGGYHLMLIDADSMEVGDVIEMTLVWETAGEMMIEIEVVDPGDTTTDAGHGG